MSSGGESGELVCAPCAVRADCERGGEIGLSLCPCQRNPAPSSQAIEPRLTYSFNIPIPTPHTTPLSTLIATLSTQTGLSTSHLKLIHKGAVLKDASLTLSSYGIHDDSTLVLIGTNEAPPTSAPAPAAPKVVRRNKQPTTDSETELTEWIEKLVHSTVDPLRPAIVTFVSMARPDSVNRPAKEMGFEGLQREHARLSELLLRGLLDLDGVEIPSAWATARLARKEGVKSVQGELGRVDEAWGERKKLGG